MWKFIQLECDALQSNERLVKPVAMASRGAQPGPRPKPGPSQIFGNLGTRKSGNLGSKKSKTSKFSKSKSILPKKSARSGSAGKRPSRPHLGHPRPFFAWAGKSKKCQCFAYFPWWANGPYSTALGGVSVFKCMLPNASSVVWQLH